MLLKMRILLSFFGTVGGAPVPVRAGEAASECV
jgi:hypothetical protein